MSFFKLLNFKMLKIVHPGIYNLDACLMMWDQALK